MQTASHRIAMRVADLGLDPRIVEILKKQGIEELYPPQSYAIGPALLGENLVLAIPTASGKSLVAYLAILASVMRGLRDRRRGTCRSRSGLRGRDFRRAARDRSHKPAADIAPRSPVSSRSLRFGDRDRGPRHALLSDARRSA